MWLGETGPRLEYVTWSKMVFTQVVPGEEYNVMLFDHDGGAITTVETYNTNIAMNALCHQPTDYGMF